MQITVQLPANIVTQLGGEASIPRTILEALGAHGYRMRKLSRSQVSQLLGLNYWKTEEFLNQYEAQRAYTLADLQLDRRSLARLPGK